MIDGFIFVIFEISKTVYIPDSNKVHTNFISSFVYLVMLWFSQLNINPSIFAYIEFSLLVTHFKLV
nr:MAG TPA: hypothetical protein [Caudoviricetes sp.]